MTRLNEPQRRCLAKLKECERKGQAFSIADLVTATGWNESTVRTYLTKKLLDRFVFREEGTGRYRARGVGSLGDEQFAQLMSQKTVPDDLEQHLVHFSAKEWEKALVLMVAHGKRRHFDVRAALERLIAAEPT